MQAELLRTNMISPEDMNLFRVTDDIEVAVREVVRFYRRFHSLRYVRDQLVIRLTEPLAKETIEKLNDQFRDVLVGGLIAPAETASEEADDFPELPRIALPFNRRSHGRLRQMIDLINA